MQVLCKKLFLAAQNKETLPPNYENSKFEHFKLLESFCYQKPASSKEKNFLIVTYMYYWLTKVNIFCVSLTHRHSLNYTLQEHFTKCSETIPSVLLNADRKPILNEMKQLFSTLQLLYVSTDGLQINQLSRITVT